MSVGQRLALASLAFALVLPASAAEQRVEAAFDVRFGPMLIGRGTFEARVGEGAYALGVSARVTGVARLISGGEGTASAQGAYSGSRLAPELYQITNTAGEMTNAIRLVMRGNAVVSERVEPPSIPLPDRIPLHDHHRRGVIDPLSAFVFPVEGAGELVQASSCQRTLRVFDGRARYDLTLSHSRVEQIASPVYDGPALVCRARYAAVAGHRRLPPGESSSYRDLEAWLVPVPGTRVLVLYRMQVGTGLGRVVVQATRFSVSPGAQQTAR
jgi:hypothetical protein